MSTDSTGSERRADRREGVRRRAPRSFTGDDRRAAERRSGDDRRQAPRVRLES
jgi:hypothetical protein